MTVLNDIGFPFTDQKGDRLYTSSDWREYFKALVTGGVVGAIANELQVKPQEVANKSIFIDTGAILINGALRVMESTTTLAVADNASGNPRIDRIVARLNYTDRKIEFAVKQGTPEGSPSAPALVQNTTTFEYSLAKITLANGYTTITAGVITDERLDEAVCGYFKYRAKPAWYPGGTPPIDAWMYVNFKNLLTAPEIAAIEGNSSLMSIINNSTLKTVTTDMWEALTPISTVGSGNWIAPDLNNGAPYTLGVLVVGGGGSGGAAKNHHATVPNGGIGLGGAAGRSLAFTMTVTPGQSIPYVVGDGGAPAVTSTSTSTSTAGNTGGTSSFNSKSATGGVGGAATNGTDSSGTTRSGSNGSTGSEAGQINAGAQTPRAPIYGEYGRPVNYSTSISFSGKSFSSEAWNPFTKKYFGGAGGYAYGVNDNTLYAQAAVELNDLLIAGAGRAEYSGSALVGYSATSPGSGGGAAVGVFNAISANIVTSGKGGSGIIRLYRKAVII
jgi:hypothetical protein